MIVKNATEAFIHTLQQLVDTPQEVPSRLGNTKEILHYHITIEKPWERVIEFPGYSPQLSQQIIGAWWVLSGNNDIETYIEYYPDAHLRSDDDVTWRGAYGPRIRNWHGIDQLEKIVRMIQHRPESRRASLTLFDPIYDFHESRDVSCANTIHFLVRNNQLHMTVDMRSVDVWSGLARNNLFEWSLLLECVAFWTGYPMGHLHFFANSMHLYSRDLMKTLQVLQLYRARQNSIPASTSQPIFETSFDEFDTQLSYFFKYETKLRYGENPAFEDLSDPLLLHHLRYIKLHHLEKNRTKETAY